METPQEEHWLDSQIPSIPYSSFSLFGAYMKQITLDLDEISYFRLCNLAFCPALRSRMMQDRFLPMSYFD